MTNQIAFVYSLRGSVLSKPTAIIITANLGLIIPLFTTHVMMVFFGTELGTEQPQGGGRARPTEAAPWGGQLAKASVAEPVVVRSGGTGQRGGNGQ